MRAQKISISSQYLQLCKWAGGVLVFAFCLATCRMQNSNALTGNPAFSRVSGNTGAINATRPDMPLKIKGTNGVYITADQTTKTLTIEGSGAGLTDTVVNSFANRTGHVLPTYSDYSSWFPRKSDISKVGFTGQYGDLINPPPISAVGMSGQWNDIEGKPAFGSAASKNAPTSGNASSGQVVMGNDTRLSGNEPSLGNPLVDGYCPSKTTSGVVTWVACGGMRGYDGLDGRTFACAILGTQSVVYDASGLNPTPLSLYQAVLYKNGSLVYPSAYSWSVPVSNTLLSGSGSSSTFTPALFGIFSSSKYDNRVRVQLTYSSMTVCQTSAPIAVAKIGAQGPQGPPGAAVVTKPTTITAFNTTPGGGPLVMQASVAEGSSASQFEIRDPSNGATRWYCSADGCDWKTLAGAKLVRVDNSGRIISYHPNGITVAFAIISSGIKKSFDSSGNLTRRELPNGLTQYFKNGRVKFQILTGSQAGGLEIDSKNTCCGCHNQRAQFISKSVGRWYPPKG